MMSSAVIIGAGKWVLSILLRTDGEWSAERCDKRRRIDPPALVCESFDWRIVRVWPGAKFRVESRIPLAKVPSLQEPRPCLGDCCWLVGPWPLAFSMGPTGYTPQCSSLVTLAAVVGASKERGSLLITFSPFRWLTGLVAIMESIAHGLARLALRLVWLNLSDRLFLRRTGTGIGWRGKDTNPGQIYMSVYITLVRSSQPSLEVPTSSS